MYSKKFDIDVDKMMVKLWGDNYFDAESKKWKTDNVGDNRKPNRRAFVQFIMDPICKLCNAIIDGQKELVDKMLVSLEIKLAQE
jgi:elongation factor 2